MNYKYLFLFLLVSSFIGCKKKTYTLYRIEGKQIGITDSLTAYASIQEYIKPYQEHIQKNLDSVISFSLDTYTKNEGHLNTAIGNFMADAVYNEANPIFNRRTGKNIDIVLLNYGGIRAIIPKGNVTARTAYELMPFENSVVVATLKGSQVYGMIDYLAKGKQAHPISKLKIVLDSNYNLSEASLNGKSIDSSATYYVATNDYLFNGGGNMDFFKPTDSLYVLNYKIRNALIDAFKHSDTLDLKIDDRFIQIN